MAFKETRKLEHRDGGKILNKWCFYSDRISVQYSIFMPSRINISLSVFFFFWLKNSASNKTSIIKKKGIIKNGKRRRLYWKYSRKYYLAKDKVADLYRKDSETRKIQRNMLANTILTMGDDIVVNDFPFELAKQRKKKDELTKKGTSKSKKKAGAIIQKTAPSALVTTMEAKLAAKENSKISKVKLENINKKEKNYRENCARLLVEWVR